jgi:hypothetical protein
VPRRALSGMKPWTKEGCGLSIELSALNLQHVDA